MPASVDRCVKDLKAKGYSEDRAWAICTAAYQKKKKSGNKKGGK